MCSKRFAPVGKQYAKVLGCEALTIIEVTDDIGHLDPQELSEVAKEVAAQIAALAER